MINKKDTLSNFEIAQELSKQYNTIESKIILANNLKKFYESENFDNYKNWEIKQFYNDLLLKFYPNETSIKAQFVNQILMKGKTHVTIFELPILNSRADLCKINGKSIAYEIKTDLDNFNRLEKQLNDYYQVFDEVFVICSTNRVDEILNIIPKETGVFSYRITKNNKYIFKKEKEGHQNLNINKKEQLKNLQNKELFNLIKNKKIISREEAIINIIDSKTDIEINKLFKNCIKSRYYKQWNFLKQNHENILEIDYQWFFKNTINPSVIYYKSF